MKIRKNGKVVNLTESDLQRIVKRTLNEYEIPYVGDDVTDEEALIDDLTHYLKTAKKKEYLEKYDLDEICRVVIDTCNDYKEKQKNQNQTLPKKCENRFRLSYTSYLIKTKVNKKSASWKIILK